MAPRRLDNVRQLGDEPLYCETDPDEVLYHGSDDEQYETRSERRWRYELAATKFLEGKRPPLITSSLRGPFSKDSGFSNPWRSKSNKHKASTQEAVSSDKPSLASLKPVLDEASHLPSPESLNSIHPHRYLDEDELASVEHWRAAVAPQSCQKDQFWAPQSTNNSARKRRAQGADWLKRLEFKRRRVAGYEQDAEEEAGEACHDDGESIGDASILVNGQDSSPTKRSPVVKGEDDELNLQASQSLRSPKSQSPIKQHKTPTRQGPRGSPRGSNSDDISDDELSRLSESARKPRTWRAASKRSQVSDHPQTFTNRATPGEKFKRSSATTPTPKRVNPATRPKHHDFETQEDESFVYRATRRPTLSPVRSFKNVQAGGALSAPSSPLSSIPYEDDEISDFTSLGPREDEDAVMGSPDSTSERQDLDAATSESSALSSPPPLDDESDEGERVESIGTTWDAAKEGSEVSGVAELSDNYLSVSLPGDRPSDEEMPSHVGDLKSSSSAVPLASQAEGVTVDLAAIANPFEPDHELNMPDETTLPVEEVQVLQSSINEKVDASSQPTQSPAVIAESSQIRCMMKSLDVDAEKQGVGSEQTHHELHSIRESVERATHGEAVVELPAGNGRSDADIARSAPPPSSTDFVDARDAFSEEESDAHSGSIGSPQLPQLRTRPSSTTTKALPPPTDEQGVVDSQRDSCLSVQPRSGASDSSKNTDNQIEEQIRSESSQFCRHDNEPLGAEHDAQQDCASTEAASMADNTPITRESQQSPWVPEVMDLGVPTQSPVSVSSPMLVPEHQSPWTKSFGHMRMAAQHALDAANLSFKFGPPTQSQAQPPSQLADEITEATKVPKTGDVHIDAAQASSQKTTTATDQTTLETPEPCRASHSTGFILRPFSAFLSCDSSSTRGSHDGPGGPGGRLPGYKGILLTSTKYPGDVRTKKAVTWASSEDSEMSDDQHHATDSDPCSLSRAASPPPEQALADLPTGQNDAFRGHFTAVKKQAKGHRHRILPTPSQQVLSSPSAMAMAERFVAADGVAGQHTTSDVELKTAEDQEHAQPSAKDNESQGAPAVDGMDDVDDVLQNLDEFLDVMDVDADIQRVKGEANATVQLQKATVGGFAFS